VSTWSQPVSLPALTASKLKAELILRGVHASQINQSFVAKGILALAVRQSDVMILNEALASIGSITPTVAPETLAIASLWNKHRAAWGRAEELYKLGDVSRISNEWLKILDPAQATAVNAMLEPGLLGFCLFDEQGTGKTFMGLGLIHHMFSSGDANQLLIFCPSSMVGEWAKKLKSVTDLTSKIRGLPVIHAAGDNLLHTCSTSVGIITNYRQAVDNIKTFQTWAKRLMPDGSYAKTLLIIDESFFVKNDEAQTSQAVLEIRNNCEFALVLCGTPAPNRPEDIIHQFNISDRGATLGLYRPTDDARQNLENISLRIDESGAFLRRLKKDVLSELPRKSFNFHKLKMSEQHRMEYDNARRSFKAQLLTHGTGPIKNGFQSILNKRAELIKLCSYPDEVIIPHQLNQKFSELTAIINDVCINRNDKLLIWSSYINSLEQIKLTVAKMGISVAGIDGSVPAEDRTKIVQQFQEEKTPQVIVANPSAAGAGLTLHAASHAVYMSYPSQAAHFLQSIDRIHRRGQRATETIFHLLVFENTIEEKEVSRLFRKESTQADLLGDVFSLPRTVEDFIAEIDA
jgi:SNF2 family DNA or RNA helicase